MKKLLATFSTFIFCYILWVLAAVSYSGTHISLEEYLAGIIICMIVAYFSSALFIKKEALWLFYPKRIGYLLVFIPVYFWHMLKANWNIAKRVLTPKLGINPGIVKIQTELKSEYAQAMLAGCITLAPGTITMDIVEEQGKAYMYVHCIEVKGKNMKDNSTIIKGVYEAWIGRFFR